MDKVLVESDVINLVMNLLERDSEERPVRGEILEELKSSLKRCDKHQNSKPNIIFLDIDGVLNTTVSPEWDEYIFDQNSIKFLQMLLKECNVKLVISSTWRSGESANFYRLLHVAGLGQTCLFYINKDHSVKHDEWRTPYEGGWRGKEIDTWLEKYGDLINNYVIIDDETHDLNEHQMNKVVQTDHFTGISYREYNRVRQLLGYEYDSNLKTIMELLK